MKIAKIPNQVITAALQPLKLEKIKVIALHHWAASLANMTSVQAIKEVERWHIQKGWRAIGYNYIVMFDGTVYEGRGLNLGAGVANRNDTVISVGFQGDFERFPNGSNSTKRMLDTQFNAGVALLQWLQQKVPTAKNIVGHRDLQANSCPGRFFPLDEFKTLRPRGSNDNKKEDFIMPEDLVRKYQFVDSNIPHGLENELREAIDLGIVSYGDQGFAPMLSERDVRTIVWCVRAAKAKIPK